VATAVPTRGDGGVREPDLEGKRGNGAQGEGICGGLGFERGDEGLGAPLIGAGAPRDERQRGGRRRVVVRARQRGRRTTERWAGPAGPRLGALCTKAQCTVSRFYFSVSVFLFLLSIIWFELMRTLGHFCKMWELTQIL
jgi:hypothetical protein